tara:strand:- start:447 stop:3062 length:2616 start_codon:yes stop_codon:yes gene_type:complete
MNEAAKASTFIGSVLKQSGFAIGETADLTERLVGLGTDLAITYGYDVQEALLGMTALFRGEYDPIEKFGVAMKQSEVNALLAERGLDKLTGAGRRLAEQQIRVEMLFDRASDAVGQYAKQSDGLFAAQQRLRATFENIEAAVGRQLIPVFADLTLAMIPLIESLLPALKTIFEALIPVVVNLTSNQDSLRETVMGVINVFVGVVKIIAVVSAHIVSHIELYRNLFIILGSLLIGIKMWQGMAVVIGLARGAVALLNLQLVATRAQLVALKIAIATTGFGLIVLAIGAIAGVALTAAGAFGDAEAAAVDWNEELDFSAVEASVAGVTDGIDSLTDSLADTTKGAGAAKDAIGDFYKAMADDAAKLSARLQLETMGASKGLIDKVLGSGEEWYKVFQNVVNEGMVSVQRVQQMFLETASGFDEAMTAWEEDFNAFKDFEKSAIEAKDALVEFLQAFSILPSIATKLGQFEQSAVDQLSSVEEQLKAAFDNGYLLDSSYRNLVEYARGEFEVLRGIERQRDQLLARRNAAVALIDSVQKSVRESVKITGILQSTQDAAQDIDVVKFATQTIMAGKSLKEFSTALITNFVEPIENAASKADLLIAGYRGVVERTREFVDNLKALKALGLDPMLFNQLVEAGVAAGGETAQALVDGGSATVTEINSLFSELDALGAELGENTAQVMYGQGENFVIGIVEGLDSQLGELEGMATSLAESFTTTFEDVLVAGIESAIAAAEAALARMPNVPGFDYQPDRDRDPDPDPEETINGAAGIQERFGISGALRAADALAVNKFLDIKSATRADNAKFGALKSMQTSGGSYSNFGVLGNVGSNTYVNVYTSSSASQVRNSYAKDTNVNTQLNSTTSINRRNLGG